MENLQNRYQGFLNQSEDLQNRAEKLQKRPEVPLLLFANKSDCMGAVQVLDIVNALQLEAIGEVRRWNIFATDALHGEGIEPGIKWMLEEVKRVKEQAKMVAKQ